MKTRKMTTRITVFEKAGGQNEDGEVISPTRKNVITCWAEVKKTSVKDFQESSRTKTGTDGLANSKDTKVFLIRYFQKNPIDNSMYIEFEGFEYKIISVEIDYASKDMSMISGVRVS